MKYLCFSMLIAFAFLAPSVARADTVDLAPVTAQGIAIYGWHNGVPTELFSQYATTPFPVASLTKLVTARVVEMLYPENTRFILGLPPMVLSRDDLLRDMLITSNNDAAREFSASIGNDTFLNAMNAFLHANNYTQSNFSNPTGLDPDQKGTLPNRLTPDSLSYLISDICRNDPLLSSILQQKTATIVDQQTGLALQLKSTNELNDNPLYGQYISLSKTGTTTLAAQSLAFVTGGEGTYDYITVVLLRSKNRYADSRLILDWLHANIDFLAKKRYSTSALQ